MRGSIRIGRISGIEIGIHYSWLLIFLFITWSLAQGFFPSQYPGWDILTYWTTGVIAALLLFAAVLAHELAHSLVAQARGLAVRSITLFIFGGVSNLTEEPQKPRVEFVMAIVGPLTSLVIAGIFWGLAKAIQNQQSPPAALFNYLAYLNLVLAIFNLIPGFPLDGGRVLRSIIWGVTGSLKKATNAATMVGRLVGWAMIAIGLYSLLTGNFLGGLWIAFIGWFLSSAADASRQEVTLREHLSAAKVKEVMSAEQTTVSPKASVEEVVWNIFQKQHGRAVPVCDDGRLVGIVTITDVKGLPRDKWAVTPVEAIMTRQPLYTVNPEDNLNVAMRLLAQHDLNQVLVLREGQCAGILSRADIIRYLQFSQELGARRKPG